MSRVNVKPLKIGSSGFRRKDDGDLEPGTWREVEGESFRVRLGPDYASTGTKAPSKRSLAKCLSVEVFRTTSKVTHLTRFLDLGDEDGKETEELGMPAKFVVNMKIPDYAPPNPVWGKATYDGKGYTLAFVFELHDWVKDELRKKETENNAIRLLRKFVNCDPDSELAGRFKSIARVVNLEEVNFNRVAKKLVGRYNETPFLIKSTASLFLSKNVFELDADVHRFSYLALVGLNAVKESVKSIDFDIAFVVQGNPDDELPEQILGACRVSKIDPSVAKVFPIPSSKYKHPNSPKSMQ